MTAAIIGISLGFLIIFLFQFLKQFDKKVIYGLILCAIGFLYVGYVWTDREDLIVNSIQAIIFLFIAYYGIQKHVYILGAGFILHGAWDIVYPIFRNSALIPPDYDLFCMSIDFVMGLYIIIFKKHFSDKQFIS
jgi:hypothetical protein